MPDATQYQVRAERLEIIERGRDTILRAQAQRLGRPDPPASATLWVRDASGEALDPSPIVADVEGGEARYLLAGTDTAAWELGTGWRVEWRLTYADGGSLFLRREAAVVSARLYPPASLVDVYRAAPALNPDHPRPLGDHTLEDLEGFLEDAWLGIEEHLLASGRLPWLVLSPHALRGAQVHGAIARAYRDLVARGRTELAEGARLFADLAAGALGAIPLTVALDDEDPTATDTVPLAGSVFLSGGRP